MANKNTRAIGTEGEQKAVEFLEENGYTILKLNYRVGRIGEIDIIAQDGEYICFIEVKTRKSYSFGVPRESVTFKKQEKIKLLASIYLTNTGNIDKPIRFDIVEILMKNNNDANEMNTINLIKNAF
ncbi:YraN family protein [Ruminiclostridium herbifermentans]|nr:YraN family protein [Ruminiclostridium herbifermentans]